MNDLLNRLGVPSDIQAFFNTQADLSFPFGDDAEHFGANFHRIPTTGNLWLAGNQNASEVIVTYSAMEAIAFMTANRQRYPNPGKLAFIAIGNKLQDKQISWISRNFARAKFTMVFGNDLLGQITCIKLGAGLKKMPLRIQHHNGKVSIHCKDKFRTFDENRITYNAFQLAFAFRWKIRTRRSAKSLTYLEQLINDTH